jgi:hypothetical protein
VRRSARLRDGRREQIATLVTLPDGKDTANTVRSPDADAEVRDKGMRVFVVAEMTFRTARLCAALRWARR